VADPGFAKGAGHGERRVRASNGGLSLRWSKGASPLKLKAQSLSIFIQKRDLKVRDLNDSSPTCPRQTASRSYDQRYILLVNRVVAAARSVDAWVRQLCNRKVTIAIESAQYDF